jgi:hypothetical protein
LGIIIILIFAGNVFLGIFNRSKYQLDISKKSIIFDIVDADTYKILNQYYCENKIYNSLEEAKANPNCIEFTLKDLISYYPVQV